MEQTSKQNSTNFVKTGLESKHFPKFHVLGNKNGTTLSYKTEEKTAAAAVMKMFVFTAVAVNFKPPPRTSTNCTVMKPSVSSLRSSL